MPTDFEKKRPLLVYGLLLSILLHLWLWFEMPAWKNSSAPSVPVDLLSQEELKQLERQLVETEKSDDTKPDPNSRLLSDRTQSARTQSKANRNSPFQARKNGGASTSPPSSSTEEEGPGEKKKSWKELTLRDLGIGPAHQATTDDHLREIQASERTVLSTREYKFHGYYQRIKELLRQHWRPRVEQRLVRMWEMGRGVPEEEMTTQLLVLLDTGGRIQQIRRLASSGVHDIDDAAVEAFQMAGPFPNPPEGIIDSDGLVRIRWDFILQAEASPRIQWQTGPQAPGRP